MNEETKNRMRDDSSLYVKDVEDPNEALARRMDFENGYEAGIRYLAEQIEERIDKISLQKLKFYALGVRQRIDEILERKFELADKAHEATDCGREVVEEMLSWFGKKS